MKILHFGNLTKLTGNYEAAIISYMFSLKKMQNFNIPFKNNSGIKTE